MKTSSTYNMRREDRRVDTTKHAGKEGRFWDRVADGYAAKAIGNEDAYRHKLTITQRYLSPQSRILELGCGTGSTALEHAPKVHSIIATDVSARMIEIAEEKATLTNTDNITFAQSTAKDAMNKGATYDGILALSLLHLLPDWRAVVHSASNALNSGGVFVTSSLCLSEQYAWLRYVAPIGRLLGLMPELVAFSRQDLKSAVLFEGLTVEYEWQADARNGFFLIARKP